MSKLPDAPATPQPPPPADGPPFYEGNGEAPQPQHPSGGEAPAQAQTRLLPQEQRARRDQPKCADAPPLLPAPRVGRNLSNAEIAAPSLPTQRRTEALRTILQGLGPDMVAGACADINRLHHDADKADRTDNLLLEVIATKTALQYEYKFVELVAGRTLNVSATIRSQRDLPRWDRLTDEDRVRLDDILNRMAAPMEAVDAEVIPTQTAE